MAFNRLMLTTEGKTIFAKYQQGKPLRLTRVGIGDGLLGSGSLINRHTLTSEKLSILVDAVQLTNENTEAAVLVTLKNSGLDAGFYFREIGIFVEDPDTHQERLYLYDNAGTDGEYIPAGDSGVLVSEHLKLLIAADSAAEISFQGSGNPLYLTKDDIDDDAATAYSLWSSTKIAAQLALKAALVHTHTPAQAGADPAGSAAEALEAAKLDATDKVAAHNVDLTTHPDVRTAITAAQQLAQEAKSIAEGRSRGVSFTSYSALVAALNGASKTAYRVGDNLFIQTTGVPDLWVSTVTASSSAYTYTSDQALMNALGIAGAVQMGFCLVSAMETEKVDLSGYSQITHIHGALTSDGKLGGTANLPVFTGTGGLIGVKTASEARIALGLGKTLTFTGAASGTYDGSTDQSINIPEGGGSMLTITFSSAFSGRAFTVTGGGETISGTVPAGLVATVALKNCNTAYTVASTDVGGTQWTDTVTTGEYFGQLTAVMEIAFTVLNENSWEKIRKVSDAGNGANYWSVGDTKRITINGAVGNTTFPNLAIDTFILGFNHNASREGTNRIHFQIGKINSVAVALVDSNYGSSGSSAAYFQMNPTNTNSGGWNGSSMRKTLLGNNGTPTNPPAGSMLAAMPPDLRAVMKSCTKYSDNTGGGSDTAGYVTSTTDYLFLLAEFEYHGVCSIANSAEKNYQTQYDYFKAGNSKIKYRHDSTGSAAAVLCRSVRYYDGTNFCLVHTDGNANYTGAYDSYGVAPGFCA